MARIVDREAKLLRILEAAATCFAQSGYEAASMSDVAEAAGVSKGSLYDYFENKEELFYAVFAWFQQQLTQTSEAEITQGVSVRDQIIDAAEAAVAGLVRHISLYPVSLEVWAAAARTRTRHRFAQAMRQIYADYRRRLSGLIRAGQAGGEIKADVDAEDLAAVMVGAIDGVLLQYWLDPDFEPCRRIQAFLVALLNGISVYEYQQ